MSITTTIIIVCLVLLVIFGASISSLWKSNKDLKNQVEAYKIENKDLQSNIAYLVKHAEEIQKIQKDADEISNKIKGAKTDEEISDIVSAIISANNDRV